MTIHVTAISEYIMRCAYYASESADSEDMRFSRFLAHIRDCYSHGYVQQYSIVYQEEYGRIKFSKPSSTDILDGKYEGAARQCLESSLSIAHDAVVKGKSLAGKRYGQKKTKSHGRSLVRLPMLQRIPADVLDELVHGLSVTLREVIGKDVDWDQFVSEITRILRNVDTIFKDIYISFHASSARERDLMRLQDSLRKESPDGSYTFMAYRLSD